MEKNRTYVKRLRTSSVLLVWAVILAVVPVAAGTAQHSFSTGIGVDFFRYQTPPYLVALSMTYLPELTDGLELNLGMHFGITTEEVDGSQEPRILLPATVGLNFTFPQEQTTYVFGVGLTPVFNITPGGDQDVWFYMGPYVKGAVRVRVHPIMSWYVELQQDLLIGKPDWINTTTRLTTGINFSIGSQDD